MKGVGEPCAGEPHARFDGRGLETERHRVTAPAPDPTNLSEYSCIALQALGQPVLNGEAKISASHGDRLAAIHLRSRSERAASCRA